MSTAGAGPADHERRGAVVLATALTVATGIVAWYAPLLVGGGAGLWGTLLLAVSDAALVTVVLRVNRRLTVVAAVSSAAFVLLVGLVSAQLASASPFL